MIIKNKFIFSKIIINRTNLLQKPKRGGIPAIDNKIINVGDKNLLKSPKNLNSFIVLKCVVSNIKKIKNICTIKKIYEYILNNSDDKT